MRHVAACTAPPPPGKQPDGSRPGRSGRTAGRHARWPRPEASATPRSARGCGAPARAAPSAFAIGLPRALLVACPPTRWRACPGGGPAAPRPLASEATGGPGAGAPPCGAWRVGSPRIPSMAVAGCQHGAGARNHRPAGLGRAARRPSPTGGRRPGRRSTQGPRPGAHPPVHRGLGGLSLTPGRPPRRPGRPHPQAPGVVDA